MGSQESMRKFLTGSFFAVGILLFVWIIFTIGENQGITQAKFKLPVLFEDVRGLSEGAPVRLSGVVIGTVDRIDFLKKDCQGRRVQVTLNVFEKYREQLNKSARFSIITDGILGEKLVIIQVLDNGTPLDLTQPVLGDNSPDVQDLAVAFAEAAQSFTKTSNELSKIDIEKLATSMEQTSQALVTTSDGINKMLPEIEHISDKAKRLINRFEQKILEGNLFKVF